MSDEKVDVGTCKVLHDQLEKRCEDKHSVIDERIEKVVEALTTIGEQLRTVLIQRAADRAWALVGKYGLTLLALAGTLFGIARYIKAGG